MQATVSTQVLSSVSHLTWKMYFFLVRLGLRKPEGDAALVFEGKNIQRWMWCTCCQRFGPNEQHNHRQSSSQGLCRVTPAREIVLFHLLIYKISGWEECSFKANVRYPRSSVIYRARAGNEGRKKPERVSGGTERAWQWNQLIDEYFSQWMHKAQLVQTILIIL